MEKIKDKTIVFRRSMLMYFDPTKTTSEEARADYVEKILAKGYVPLEPEIKHVAGALAMAVGGPVAYAGKKMARKIGVQKRGHFDRINILPY